MKILNSPIKRICFLMMLLGFITLLISLFVWSSNSRYKIYYTKDHYRWMKIESPIKGSERYWQIDYKCAENRIQSYLKEAQNRLDDLKTKEPEQVDITKIFSFTLNKSKKEKERNQKAYEIRKEWGKKYRELEIEIKLIKERNYYQYSTTRAHRESEIKQRMKPLTNTSYLTRKKDSRTEDEKFTDALKSQLSIFIFPKEIQNEVFNECTRQGYLHYTFIETTTHSDIKYWVEDHWIAFWAGISLVVTGFFGSIGFGITSKVYEITLKKLFKWIKAEDTDSQ